MSLTIELSDEQATALQAKAAEGLSVEEWLQKLARQDPPLRNPCKPRPTLFSPACATSRLKLWRPCPMTARASMTITSTHGNGVHVFHRLSDDDEPVRKRVVLDLMIYVGHVVV